VQSLKTILIGPLLLISMDSVDIHTFIAVELIELDLLVDNIRLLLPV